MTYATYIAKLRIKLHDLGDYVKDTWNGDNSNILFHTSRRPIKDSSYVVKIGGSTKTEITDYTIDKDTGVITFTSAPASGSDNVQIEYLAYKVRDDEYIEFINGAIDYFRWKFWKESIDTTTITSVQDQYEYDLSSLTGIIYIVQVWHKTTSGSSVWEAVQEVTNWKWLPRQTKLYINPTFDVNSLPMKFLYLKSLTKGTIVSSTLDIPDEWLLPYEYYIKARFYENLVPEKIHETSAITTQPSFTPAQVVLNIVEHYDKKATEIANRIAPKMPPMPIKQTIQGISF